MENKKILTEIENLIAYCKQEFDINQEAFNGINDPYADGRYYGAKEAYSDMLYKIQMVRDKIIKEEK